MSSSLPSSQDPSKAKPRRRGWRIVGIVLLLLIGLIVAAPFVAAPFVRDKIESMVSDHLHGELQIGSLSYSFPYGVHVRDAQFVTDAEHGSVKVLTVKAIDLSLKQLPFRKGPIVVRHLSITEPVIRIIRQADGSIFGYNIPKRGAEAPPTERQMKLSDVLQLRKFDLVSASIVIEDQTQPNEVPLEWHDIDAHLNLENRSKSSYGFAFAADNKPIAHVDLAGSADIDALTVEIEKLAVTAQVKRDDPSSPLPPRLQSILRKLGIEGAVRLDASGGVPINKPAAGRFNVALNLDGVKLAPLNQPYSLDRMKLTLNASKSGPVIDPASQSSTTRAASTQSASTASAAADSATTESTTAPADNPSPVHIWLSDFDATGMGGKLTIPAASAIVDLANKSWSLEQIEGKLESQVGAIAATVPDATTESTTSPSTTLPATATTSNATTDATTPATASASTPPTTTIATRPVTRPATRPRRTLDKYVLAGNAEFTAGGTGVLAATQPAQFVPKGHAVITLNNLVLRPPGFDEPVTNLVGTIRLVDRAVLFDRISASFGADYFALTQAFLSFDDPTVRIQLRDIVAQANFGSPMASYPAPLDELMKHFQVSGRYDLDGAAGVYLARGKIEPDYALRISPRNASATLIAQDHPIPFTNLNGEIGIAPKAITVPALTGNLFKGAFSATATALPAPPFNYEATLRADGIDMAAASNALDLMRPDGKPKISGLAKARVTLNGSVPGGNAIAGVAGHGFARIENGDLWSLNLFSAITDNIPGAKGAVTAGDAVAVFDLKDQKVNLTRLAVSSTALGVQGNGTIGLVDDNPLDLQVVVAPLGDWRQRIREWKIPLFSDVAGQFAGAMQKVVNTTTSSLLYQFRVKGTAKEPKLSAIPAPILTEGVAKVFGTMLKGGKADSLSEDLGAKEPEEKPVPKTP